MPHLTLKPLARIALLWAMFFPAVAVANDATPTSNWLETLVQLTDSQKTSPWTYVVVDEFPHDPSAFTEGLVLRGNDLYESTGLNGQSGFRLSDLKSGEIERQVTLPEEYFGEGIAIIGDRLFQLTWKSGVAFVYNVESFERIGQFSYGGEGWGLTTDGENLIMSNGTDEIVYRDPDTFEIVKSIQVSDDLTPVTNLNELEWINGEIWANVWQTDFVVRIDPESGSVLGWIDFTGLLPLSSNDPSPGVLNGIAWDAEAGRLLVTGKNWPTIFQVELVGH